MQSLENTADSCAMDQFHVRTKELVDVFIACDVITALLRVPIKCIEECVTFLDLLLEATKGPCLLCGKNALMFPLTVQQKLTLCAQFN